MEPSHFLLLLIDLVSCTKLLLICSEFIFTLYPRLERHSCWMICVGRVVASTPGHYRAGACTERYFVAHVHVVLHLPLVLNALVYVFVWL
jgi:hypothetical protein